MSSLWNGHRGHGVLRCRAAALDPADNLSGFALVRAVFVFVRDQGLRRVWITSTPQFEFSLL